MKSVLAFTYRTWIVSLTIAMVSSGAKGQDGSPDHPVVPGYERFFAERSSYGPSGGRLLLGELNCVACHQADTATMNSLLKKQAPILDDVGARVRPEFLRAFLTSPQQAKPGTTMPDLFASVAAEQREQHVEALVHFLASTGQLLEAGPITPAVTSGETLFHTVGCVACHDSRRENAPRLTSSVPLPAEMEAKYSVPGLTEFLQNPLHTRPSGRMPHLNLTDKEARDIASYLLRNLTVEGNVEFAYYEGNWQELPNFSRLEPHSSGKTNSFDVNLGRADQFGIVFRAKFRVARDGKYKFHLGSDDGSRLKIDGRTVVDVDGIHPLSFKSSDMQLTTGTHDVEIEYFEQSGEQVLQVEFEGPGVKRQALEYALVSATTESADSSRFVVDAALAERGQQLFGTLGCVACHQLRSEDRVIPAAPTFKPLAALDSSCGCLAVQTAAVSTDTAVQTNKVPNFHLSAGQRTALATALAALGQPATNAANAEVQIHHTLTAFNCYACHQRGEQGGIEEVRNAWFQSDQPEMGDEGRIPPHLTGVGAKLQPEWLKQLFDRGAKDRPYMFTRMPRFGSNNIGPLVTALAKADPPIADHVEVDQFDERHLKAAGRKLVGAEGFSCIKCHTWGDVKATGIQSINMVTMTRRLQANWFHQYMLDPQRYRPGTRMPAAWPQGQVLLPTLLDGQASTQIQSIWNYLSDGDKAAMPIGLGTDPIVLTATDEPIIYRNFIEGAGARAIGVGYPEKVNQAFDANNLRVALLWHGAFIDASKHWLGRGPGFQPPLGDNVLTLPDGVSFAILEDATAAWPTQTAKELGYAFRGYRLGEVRRPTFHYTLGGVRVEDELVPISRDQFAPARRTLTLYATTPVTNLWYRAAVGKSVEAQADGSYLIDGSWKVRVPSDATRRESSGNVELLVPIDLSSGTTTLIQEYAW